MEKLKTNQVLSRKMGNFEVLQRTSDGMFNATALLVLINIQLKVRNLIEIILIENQ